MLVAALGVAIALFLAVRFAPAVHRARVGREVAGAVETSDIAGLQGDRQREHLADAADGLERAVVLARLALARVVRSSAVTCASRQRMTARLAFTRPPRGRPRSGLA